MHEQKNSSSAKARNKKHPGKQSIAWQYLLVLLILPAMGIADLAINYQAPWGLLVYLLASLLAYYFFWDDKRRAKRNDWRIPEASLHFWSLLGGWPGAFIAQQQFRHKTKKLPFQIVFWLLVAVHQLVWFDWLFLDAKSLLSLGGL